MSHSHTLGGGMDGGNSRALQISAWLTGIYFVVELAIGIYTGSIAVISDAFHTFSAVGGVLLAFVAAKIATRPATTSKTFGFARAEIVGALLNGMFLLGMALIVFVMGYMRLRNPIDLPTGPMLFAAAGGLITETISLWLLYGRRKGNLNMQGAFWHVMQTFVGSLLIIVTALVIKFTGFLAIDPILGMAFGVVLLLVSIGVIRESIDILMEGTPRDIDLPVVVSDLEAIPNVTDVHHVHAWALTSGRNVFSAHVRIGNGADLHNILVEAHKNLKDKFGFHFSTLQIETTCMDEAHARDLEFNQHGEDNHDH